MKEVALMETQDDNSPTPASTHSLKDAVRKARMTQAERTDVIVELRSAEVARLEMLQDELSKVFEQMDGEADQFELALTQGQVPRLWVDMLAFVSMSRDRKVYRFQRDTRAGRQVLAEAQETGPIVDAVTDYIAHRIVEREKALANTPSKLQPRREDYVDASTAPTAPPRRRGAGAFTVLLAFLLGAAASAAALLGYAYIYVP